MDAPGGGHSFRHCTTRPVMGFFFARAVWTHLEPQQFFGIAFGPDFPSILWPSNCGFGTQVE